MQVEQKRCRICNVILVVGENWYASRAKYSQYICNNCYKEYKRNKREQCTIDAQLLHESIEAEKELMEERFLAKHGKKGGGMKHMHDDNICTEFYVKDIPSNITGNNVRFTRNQEILNTVIRLPPNELNKYLTEKIKEVEKDLELYRSIYTYLYS